MLQVDSCKCVSVVIVFGAHEMDESFYASVHFPMQ